MNGYIVIFQILRPFRCLRFSSFLKKKYFKLLQLVYISNFYCWDNATKSLNKRLRLPNQGREWWFFSWFFHCLDTIYNYLSLWLHNTPQTCARSISINNKNTSTAGKLRVIADVNNCFSSWKVFWQALVHTHLTFFLIDKSYEWRGDKRNPLIIDNTQLNRGNYESRSLSSAFPTLEKLLF